MMANLSISIMLQVGYADGRNVQPNDLMTALEIDMSDSILPAVHHGARKWEYSRLIFFEASDEQYQQHPEPSEVFAQDVASALEGIARWLDARPANSFDILRQVGVQLDMLIYFDIDYNQLDLSLPVPFLMACAKHDLRIDITTND